MERAEICSIMPSAMERTTTRGTRPNAMARLLAHKSLAWPRENDRQARLQGRLIRSPDGRPKAAEPFRCVGRTRGRALPGADFYHGARPGRAAGPVRRARVAGRGCRWVRRPG